MKTKPPADLSADSPRLTDLPGLKHPNVCQACGGSHLVGEGNGIMRLCVDRWQEHDERDRKEAKIVVLCDRCSRKLIEPHPRLYEKLHPNAPWPGCMAICLDCKLRDGIRCTSPAAKFNGGPGVNLTISKPIGAMIDGRDYSGPITLWTGPATACEQRQPYSRAELTRKVTCSKCPAELTVATGYNSLTMTNEQVRGCCKKAKWHDDPILCPECKRKAIVDAVFTPLPGSPDAGR